MIVDNIANTSNSSQLRKMGDGTLKRTADIIKEKDLKILQHQLNGIGGGNYEGKI